MLAIEKVVSNKWVPEISHHMPDTPYILVGTKSDLRSKHSMKETSVKFSEIVECCETLGFSAYVECSAKEGDRIERVFQVAVQSFVSYEPMPEQQIQVEEPSSSEEELDPLTAQQLDEGVARMVDMGFTAESARAALEQYQNLDEAIESLLDD